MRTVLGGALCAGLAAASYSCVNFDIPLSFESIHEPALIPPFENHYQSVAFLNAATARNAASAPSPLGEPKNITVDVTIAAQYCHPNGQQSSTIQVLTHGLGFDRSYWDFGGPGSQYNYIETATSAGYSVISYDRMGTGNSTIKDPYNVQQLAPETGVLLAITKLLRQGELSKLAGCTIPTPKKVFHVGHSFGSDITHNAAAISPTYSDGIVLTGYSVNGTFGAEFIISSNFHIAKQDQARLSAYKSDGWLTWGDELSNQYNFLHYPNFSTSVLGKAEATKMPIALGELLTVLAGAPEADKYTGPAMVISGQYDRIYCGAWCPGLLHYVKQYLPKAKPFATYIQPDTGHGMNLHYNATGTYKVINDFITANA